MTRFLALCFVCLVASSGCAVDANVGALPRETPDAADPTLVTDGGGGDVREPPGCGVTLEQEGDWVVPTRGEIFTPDGEGGTLVPGTYILTSAVLHHPISEMRRRREVLVLTGSNKGTFARRIEVPEGEAGPIPPPKQAGEFTSWADGRLYLDPSCPEGLFEGGSYTAEASTLSIFDQSVGAALVYTRVR